MNIFFGGGQRLKKSCWASVFEGKRILAPSWILRVADHWNFKSHGEKRQALLAETADVAEESQIYIFGENGASELAEPFTEDQKRRILAMSPRTGVDVIHKILYGGSITRNGNTVFFDGKNSHALKLHLDAPGFTPRRGPVTLEEFEKYLPRALAEKPRVKSGKNKKNKKISNKIYKITDNDVIYTLVTASRGEFKSFYSNKKTANAVTDPNRSSATGMLPKHNISQNPENASWNLSDESDMSDVSDKLRFSLEEYSESEQEDITAVLRPFVGRNIDMDPEKYRGYLKEKGILIPDKDADTFFRPSEKMTRRQGRGQTKSATSGFLRISPSLRRWQPCRKVPSALSANLVSQSFQGAFPVKA